MDVALQTISVSFIQNIFEKLFNSTIISISRNQIKFPNSNCSPDHHGIGNNSNGNNEWQYQLKLKNICFCYPNKRERERGEKEIVWLHMTLHIESVSILSIWNVYRYSYTTTNVQVNNIRVRTATALKRWEKHSPVNFHYSNWRRRRREKSRIKEIGATLEWI